jgi:hypothetical protein
MVLAALNMTLRALLEDSQSAVAGNSAPYVKNKVDENRLISHRRI